MSIVPKMPNVSTCVYQTLDGTTHSMTSLVIQIATMTDLAANLHPNEQTQMKKLGYEDVS